MTRQIETEKGGVLHEMGIIHIYLLRQSKEKSFIL